ncbi:MAG TPA: ankyrin repeat domain-containing protein [Chitinophagaceae bacterium]|nr:ankyrin repeat domain-containing protein [Chitinophagaceae bacterium]
MRLPVIQQLMARVDYEGIRKLLAQNPTLANEGLPADEMNPIKAHPLHRICDGVFAKTYTDEQAAAMAKIFLEHKANVNGYVLIEGKDSPLTAAASLHADEVAFLYIEYGADIHHPGCHGGTALHWAAWCGRDRLVQRLLQAGADINKRCFEYTSTPLVWAVHGYKFGGRENRHHQLECARMLLQAGADKNIPNKEGYKPVQFLEAEDADMMALLA